MPYARNAALPKPVRDALPSHAQSIYRAAWNSAAAQHGEADEGRLARIAWGAVKRTYAQNDEGVWVKKQAQHQGIWIGFALPIAIGQDLAVDGGEAPEDMHITVAYIPDADALAADSVPRVIGAMTALSLHLPVVHGVIAGTARFNASETADDNDVLVALVDSPSLEDIRAHVKATLAAVGVPCPETHGYQPHITLAFVPQDSGEVPQIATVPLVLDTLEIRFPDTETVTLQLHGVQKDAALHVIAKDATRRFTLGVVYEPYVLDTDDEFASPAVIEKAAWEFMRVLQGATGIAKASRMVFEAIGAALNEGDAVRLDVTDVLDDLRKGHLGDQHTSWDDDYGEVVECYIAPCDMHIGDEYVRKGTWLMGVVWSEAYFTKIEAGERTGFSMGGFGRTQIRELRHAA